MNRSPVRISASLCTLFLAAAGASAETHPFSVHDMQAMDRISDPRVSPAWSINANLYYRWSKDLYRDNNRGSEICPGCAK